MVRVDLERSREISIPINLVDPARKTSNAILLVPGDAEDGRIRDGCFEFCGDHFVLWRGALFLQDGPAGSAVVLAFVDESGANLLILYMFVE